MNRIILIFLGFFISVYAEKLTFTEKISLNLDISYPEKNVFYIKEPVKITVNITSKDKEVLSYIDVIPLVDKSKILFFKKKSISKSTLKVKFTFFLLKTGTYIIPFSIKIKSSVLNLEKKIYPGRNFIAVSIPSETVYVGNFQIKTFIKNKNGLAEFHVVIKGRGFPFLPEHNIVVKNGSGKKIRTIINRDLDFIEQEEVFKIIYLDKLEIRPVKFVFFNPFKSKIVELKTEPVIIDRGTQKKELIKYDTDFYLKKFSSLYPEFFVKENPYKRYIIMISTYKYHMILSFLIFLFILYLYLFRVSKKQIPEHIQIFMSIDIKNREDLKKLYKFITLHYYSLKKDIEYLEGVIFGKQKIDKRRINSILKNIVTKSPSSKKLLYLFYFKKFSRIIFIILIMFIFLFILTILKVEYGVSFFK